MDDAGRKESEERTCSSSLPESSSALERGREVCLPPVSFVSSGAAADAVDRRCRSWPMFDCARRLPNASSSSTWTSVTSTWNDDRCSSSDSSSEGSSPSWNVPDRGHVSCTD